MTTSTELGASMCGKVPLRVDFVSLHCQYDEAIALDEWLGQEVAAAHRAGGALPKQRARFVLTFPGRTQALLGVLEPSRDQAGRKYPAAVFVPVERSAAAGSFGALPLAATRFWRDAEALFDGVTSLSYEALKERLAALGGPTPAEVDAARDALAAGLDEDAGSFAARVLGDDGTSAAALERVGRAVVRAARTDDAARAPVLKCPAPGERDVAVWCELARRARGSAPPAPSLWWGRGDGSPCWIALCRPPRGQLGWVSGVTGETPVVDAAAAGAEAAASGGIEEPQADRTVGAWMGALTDAP